VVLPKGMEFEVAEKTLFVTGGTMLMLGSKGNSTKSLSQTFESRDSQMRKEDLTQLCLEILKKILFLYF